MNKGVSKKNHSYFMRWYDIANKNEIVFHG